MMEPDLPAIGIDWLTERDHRGSSPATARQRMDWCRSPSGTGRPCWVVFRFVPCSVLAAAGAFHQPRIANFVLWCCTLGTGLLSAIAHFAFPNPVIAPIHTGGDDIPTPSRDARLMGTTGNDLICGLDREDEMEAVGSAQAARG